MSLTPVTRRMAVIYKYIIGLSSERAKRKNFNDRAKQKHFNEVEVVARPAPALPPTGHHKTGKASEVENRHPSFPPFLSGVVRGPELRAAQALCCFMPTSFD